MSVHSRPTLAVSTSPAAADEPAPRGAPAPQVKPKIMRRPAQFSTPTLTTANTSTPDLHLDAPQPVPQHLAAPMPRPWQDDPRFAIALLAIVIIVNVALSLWLSPSSTAPSIADTTRESANPAAASSAPTPEEALLFHLGEAAARVSEQ